MQTENKKEAEHLIGCINLLKTVYISREKIIITKSY